MRLEWEFPVAVDQVNADQAQAFANALAVAAASPYSSEMESVASELAVTEPMADTLTSFITAQTAVLAVLLWQATGADAVIDTNGAAYDVTPAVEKSITAVPGVRHAAAVWTTTWLTPHGQQQLNVAAVDPAGYAAMTADTPFPRIP